jgi:hypothetical protein
LQDRLTLLLEAGERLTVDLVAQEPVVVRLETETPGYARHVADRENFDVLPIKEKDGRIVRYVRRATLEQHLSDTEWDGIRLDAIDPDDIVSAASPMLELLDRFSSERPRLFVLGRRGIDAIVTVYDLNQPAAHQFGFALSLVVEAELADAIERAARKTKDELDTEVDARIRELVMELPAQKYGGARKRASAWQRKVNEDEQVRLTRELVFNDKIGLVELMGIAPSLASRCRHPYSSSGDELVRRLREEVKALRNAVAHDTGELADEWSIWAWMRTTLHLASDLARRVESLQTR